MTVTLTWDPNPETELVSEYKVYQSYQGGPFELIGSTAETSFDIVDPVPGIYNWKVSAVNLAGEGSQSNAIAGPQLPSIPANVTVEVI